MALFSIADIVAAIFLLIAVVDAIVRHDDRGSSKAITVTLIASCVMVLLDSLSGLTHPASTPGALLYVAEAFAVVATKGILLFFYYYCYQYFRERVAISKWLFIVPMALLACTMVAQAGSVFSEGYMTVSNGEVVVTGSVPRITNLATIVLSLYLPVLALIKRKDVGVSAVFFVGALAIVPVVIAFMGLHDYTTCCGALIVFVTYVLLQNGNANRQERERRILEENNAELESLNLELEERQAQLEEVQSEQEAQIEETQALNNELEERQAQLEEATAEQEAQIEEIGTLNAELEGQRATLESRLHIIRSLSNRYFATYYVDISSDEYTEITSIGNIQQHYEAQGDAQAALTGMVPVLMHPEFKETMQSFVDLPTVVARLKDADSITQRYVGNTTGWSEASFVVCDRDEDGTPTSVVFCAREVNGEVEADLERQRVLEAARDAAEAHSEELAALNKELSEQNDTVANAGLGMWHIILKEGCAPRMQANWKMLEILGIPGRTDMSEEEVYSWWWDRITPDAIPSVNASVGEMLDGRFSENTYLWEHPTKGLIYTRCGGTCVTLEDGTHIVSGYHGDVTDVVYKEEQQKQELAEARDAANAANAAKTSFLFNMSHDIRTPMNAIIGFSNLLEKYQEDPVRREDYLRKIQSSSDVLLEIINNVLDMARIESGTTTLEEKAWSAEQFNDTLYSVFAEMMKTKDIEFVRSIDVEHDYVFCDATKMTQVFNNILSNACKYTEPGGRVEMRLEELPSDRDGYALFRTTIADTGIGMDADYLPHIFEEFSREHTSTEAKIEGTGLGMPIVKRLVDLMGGTIEATSEKGVGSTFVVKLYHLIASRSDLSQADALELGEETFSGRRILLAEDNDLNAEIAIEILGEAGFVIERAEDGDIAVRMLEKAPAGTYDVVLMDIQMPNMNGYEATRAIRAMCDEAKARIPILAMTANAFEEDKREALRNGMDGHVAKPIDVDELMNALAGVLE